MAKIRKSLLGQTMIETQPKKTRQGCGRAGDAPSTRHGSPRSFASAIISQHSPQPSASRSPASVQTRPSSFCSGHAWNLGGFRALSFLLGVCCCIFLSRTLVGGTPKTTPGSRSAQTCSKTRSSGRWMISSTSCVHHSVFATALYLWRPCV